MKCHSRVQASAADCASVVQSVIGKMDNFLAVPVPVVS